MSYVEHGPRIFLAARPSNDGSLTYGDYILPKKRSEGRLKMYESCSDIRAWSPNPLENSRYFRELTEHAAPAGRIVPFNVIIDNIIELNSQTRKELQQALKELRKYKSLKLSVEQEHYLQNYDESATGDHKRANERAIEQESEASSKQALVSLAKSVSVTQSDCYLSIHLRPADILQVGSKYCPGLPLMSRGNQLAGWQRFRSGFVASTLSTNDGNIVSDGTAADMPFRREERSTEDDDSENDRKTERTAAHRKQLPTCVEFVDTFSQAEEVRDIRDAGVQTDAVVSDSGSSKTTVYSENSDTSSACQCCTRDGTQTLRNEGSSKEDNNEESAFESSSTSSQDSLNSEDQTDSDSATVSTFDFERRKKTYKKIIIKKDSVIIALTHELRAKEAEISELCDLKRNFEDSLKEKEKSLNMLLANLKISQDELGKMNEEREYEAMNLKKKLYAYTGLIEDLQRDIDKKCQVSVAQRQEIEKLRLCAKEAAALRAEKESFIVKLREMERQLKDAEDRVVILEQLKAATFEERDELRNQTREQHCLLADKEDEIKRLLISTYEISDKYESWQSRMENEMDDLRGQIRRKDEKITQCEEQLIEMGREVNELQAKLKNSLMQNLDRFQSACEGRQEFHSKQEHFLEHVSDEKYVSENVRNENMCVHKRGAAMSYQRSDNESIYDDSNEDIGSKNVITLRSARTTESWESNEQPDTDVRSDTNMGEAFDECTSVNNDSDKESAHLDTWRIVKESYEAMNRKLRKQLSELHQENDMDEVGKELVEQTSQYLTTAQSFMQKLQTYVEEEWPLMIKQIRGFHESLKGITAQKKKSYDLFNKHLDQCNKCKPYRKYMSDESCDSDYKAEFNEMILYQQPEEILQQEEMLLYDEHVDRILAMHIKCSIDRICEMSAALQGAGDQHVEIVREIEKQRREIEVRDEEIRRLKAQVAERGDGDCPEDQEKKARLADEKLAGAMAELNGKNAMVQELRERLNLFEHDRTAWSGKYNALRVENKDLVDKWNALLKENDALKADLEQRNDEIRTLLDDNDDARRRLDKQQETIKVLSEGEAKMRQMKFKLDRLQTENAELRKELIRAEDLRSKNEEYLSELKDVYERTKNEISCLSANNSVAVQKQQIELDVLRDENKALNEKWRQAECRLAEREKTILMFSDEKIVVLKDLAEIVSKSGEDKERFELQIGNLETQLTSLSASNKKLERKLEDYVRMIRELEREIECWKKRHILATQQLSVELAEEASPKDDLKNRLLNLSNRIYERITFFSKNFAQKKQSVERRADKACQREEENFVQRYEDLITAMDRKDDELKELRAKLSLVEKNLQCDKCVGEDALDEASMDAEVTKDTNDNPCNIAQMRYELKCLQGDNAQKQIEIRKLTKDVEIGDREIKSFTEKVNRLSQETEELHRKLKAQTEEYRMKLAALKKKYDSSLNATRKRHEEDVKRLQATFFDDAMKGEWAPFDSEKWLKSLGLKELTDLENRILALISSNDEADRVEQDSVDKRDLNGRINGFEDKNREVQNGSRHKEKSHDGSNEHDQKGNINEANRNCMNSEKGAMVKTKGFRWHSTTFNYKQQFGLFNDIQEKIVKNTKFKLTNEPVKDDTFDKQRKNFIYQCSMYHRSGYNA